MAYSRRLVDRAVARGRSTAEQGAALLARLTPTTEVAALAGCDVVIEAVFEDPALKRRVYAEVEPLLAAGALLATNTSTLPITALAAGLAPAGGLHRHALLLAGGADAAAGDRGGRADQRARPRPGPSTWPARLGKTPIVVNDGRGFFTSRVIGRFMDEAIGMVAEGVPPPSVEQAALQAGYPTGPLALADEVSLTLIQRIRAEYAAADGRPRPVPGAAGPRRWSARWRPRAEPAGPDGRGFYDYAPDGARLRLWPGLAALAPAPGGRAVPFADLQERMLFAEALDALACLEEGVLRSARDANIGSILGIGFPPWTGGVIRYVEQYPGGTAGFGAGRRSWPPPTARGSRPPADLVDRARRPYGGREGHSPGFGWSSWPASPRRRSAAWCSPTSGRTCAGGPAGSRRGAGGRGAPTSGPLQRGRRVPTLDLTDPAGAADAAAPGLRADVLVEGFRPGVTERLGIGPRSARRATRGWSTRGMTGWGQDGPMAADAGHDIDYLAVAGALATDRAGPTSRPCRR